MAGDPIQGGQNGGGAGGVRPPSGIDGFQIRRTLSNKKPIEKQLKLTGPHAGSLVQRSERRDRGESKSVSEPSRQGGDLENDGKGTSHVRQLNDKNTRPMPRIGHQSSRDKALDEHIAMRATQQVTPTVEERSEGLRLQNLDEYEVAKSWAHVKKRHQKDEDYNQEFAGPDFTVPRTAARLTPEQQRRFDDHKSGKYVGLSSDVVPSLIREHPPRGQEGETGNIQKALPTNQESRNEHATSTGLADARQLYQRKDEPKGIDKVALTTKPIEQHKGVSRLSSIQDQALSDQSTKSSWKDYIAPPVNEKQEQKPFVPKDRTMRLKYHFGDGGAAPADLARATSDTNADQPRSDFTSHGSYGYSNSTTQDGQVSAPLNDRYSSSTRKEDLRDGKQEHTMRERRREKIRRNKQSIQKEDFDDDDGDLEEEYAERRQRKRERQLQKASTPATPIILPEFISISNLATALRVKVDDFVLKLSDLGFEEINNDYVVDGETAGLIAAEFNFDPIIDRSESQDLFARAPSEDKSVLPSRPPVVTIMGHVDHGKTTLLDHLRKSSVAASEHGGITQHIGAFTVPMPSGKVITFLDTPGHAAFLSMRQRGANVTDIVILVVAADDSVKPQTIEAIKHAKAASVPIIVAINKIDKQDSNPELVQQDLARHGVEVESIGGDTQVVCVSGKTGKGIAELEDATVALADVLDMRAETDGAAEGWVLEATTKRVGRVATVLVRRGTIHPGDVIVAGSTWARVRTLRSEAGLEIESAGPGTPVEIDGWREQPEAGDEVLQAPDEQKAKAVVDFRVETTEKIQMAVDMQAINEARRLMQEKRDKEEADAARATAEAEQIAAGVELTPTNTSDKEPTPGRTEVPIIIKADVSGSVEAIQASILSIGNTEVCATILRAASGPVSETDIAHASAARGLVISFGLDIDPGIAHMAQMAGVRILEERVIYRLTDVVKGILEEKLPPKRTKRVLGEADVLQVFEIGTTGRKTVPVAGCRVRNGVVGKMHRVRVLREGKELYDGTYDYVLSNLLFTSVPTSLVCLFICGIPVCKVFHSLSFSKENLFTVGRVYLRHGYLYPGVDSAYPSISSFLAFSNPLHLSRHCLVEIEPVFTTGAKVDPIAVSSNDTCPSDKFLPLNLDEQTFLCALARVCSNRARFGLRVDIPTSLYKFAPPPPTILNFPSSLTNEFITNLLSNK